MTNDGQMPSDRQRLTEVAAQFGLRLVLLFGSVARGQARPDSDCDIAVAGCPPDRFWDLAGALQRTIPGGVELDLVRLEPADPLFRYEILRDAVLLYGDPDLYCEVRAFAFRDFHDSASLFALERTLLRKKLARIKERLRAEAVKSAQSSCVIGWERLAMYRYEVIIYWSEEDDAFVAEVPELPGCMAHGDSYETALANAQEAIRLGIDTAREFGDPVPEPRGRRLHLA